MPGRNPQEAVDAFLDPLREATRVLDGHAQIIVAKKGGYRKGGQYTWMLCGPDGMNLRRCGRFYAEMRFEVIDADQSRHDGPLRVTTRGYRYRFEIETNDVRQDLWLIHWHPSGDSPYKEPHIHIPHNLDRHLPTGRITFEKVIAWCIEYGAPTTCDKQEALSRLAVCEAPHILHRTWSSSPDEAQRFSA